MLYDSVKAGKKVSSIIRETREGLASVAVATGKYLYKNGPETAAMRMLSALSPSCFAPVSWWTRLTHGSTFGQSTVAKIWVGVD